MLTRRLCALILSVVTANVSAETFFVHADHLGTPQALTDASGAVVWRADYDPFGRATVDPSSTVEFNVRFPGQYFDEETGLHYNYYRDYDPDTGRYLQPDPIGLTGLLRKDGLLYDARVDFSRLFREDEADAWPSHAAVYNYDVILGAINSPGHSANLYTYVDGNPITRTDTKGEHWIGYAILAGYSIAAVLIGKDCVERCTGCELASLVQTGPGTCPCPQSRKGLCFKVCGPYALLLGFGVDPFLRAAETVGESMGGRHD